MQLAHKVLTIIAIISVLLTVYMASEYVSTYIKIMRTQIKGVIKKAEFHEGQLKVSVEISIVAKGKPFKVHKIEYTLFLNNKYLLRDKISQSIILIPEKEVKIERELTIPEERMFTVWEAIQINRWKWKVLGTLFTQTFFGETLIRFKFTMNLTPEGTP